MKEISDRAGGVLILIAALWLACAGAYEGFTRSEGGQFDFVLRLVLAAFMAGLYPAFGWLIFMIIANIFAPSWANTNQNSK